MQILMIFDMRSIVKVKISYFLKCDMQNINIVFDSVVDRIKIVIIKFVHFLTFHLETKTFSKYI